MTKEKKAKLSDIETRQNSAFIDFKLQMVPASIKNTYSSIGGKDELVSRELIVNNNQVFIGIEYADGVPVSAYTTDPTGKRIFLEKLDNENVADPMATRDVISNRLSELSKQVVRDKHKSKDSTPEKVVKVVQPSKQFKRKVSERE